MTRQFSELECVFVALAKVAGRMEVAGVDDGGIPGVAPGTEGRVTRPGLPCVSDGDDDEASAYLEAQGAALAGEVEGGVGHHLRILLADIEGQRTASADAVDDAGQVQRVGEVLPGAVERLGPPRLLGPSLACAAISGDC